MKNHKKRLTGLIAGLLALTLFPLIQYGGQVTIQFYDGIGFIGIEGVAVEDLTNDPSFPDLFTADDFLPIGASTHLEFIDGDAFDNYGTWTRGYIEAPETGEYSFYIASDDAAEFWLSSDHQVIDRSSGTPTAFESECCTGSLTSADGLFGSVRIDQRKSAPVSLVRGNKYYFEVLHKEGAGGSWWRLGWELPGGGQEQIQIRSAAPYAPNSNLSILTPPLPQSVSEPSPASFSVDVTAVQPTSFQWLLNGQPVDGAILSHFTIDETTLSMDGDRYSARVTDGNGVTATSDLATLSVTVDTTAPVAAFAVTGGNLNEITVGFSERVTAETAEDIANYTVSDGVEVQGATLSVNGDSVLLNVSALNQLQGYTVDVRNVVDRADSPNVMDPNPTSLSVILFDIFDFDQTSEGPWSDLEHTTAMVPKVPRGVVKQDGVISADEYGGFKGVTVIGGIHGHINAFPNDRSWGNPADSSFTFFLAHDDEWFYVGVDVKDDVINTDDDPRSFWKDDSIELVVDVLNDDLDVNTDSSLDTYGGHLYFNFEGKTSDTSFPDGVKDDGNFRWAGDVEWTYGEEGEMFGFGEPVEGGWRTEMRLKKTLFEDPEVGNVLDNNFKMGFNIGIDDDDKRGPGTNGSGARSQDLEIQYFWANRARRQGFDQAYLDSGAPVEDLPLVIDSAGRISHGGAGDVVFLPGPLVSEAPLIAPPVLGSNTIEISWTGGGSLQSSGNVNGPWVDVSQESPFSAATDSPATFYRVAR